MCMRYTTNQKDDGGQDGRGGVTLFLEIGSTFREANGVDFLPTYLPTYFSLICHMPCSLPPAPKKKGGKKENNFQIQMSLKLRS